MHRASRPSANAGPEVAPLCDPTWATLDRDRVCWTWVDKETTCPACLAAIVPARPYPTAEERTDEMAALRAENANLRNLLATRVEAARPDEANAEIVRLRDALKQIAEGHPDGNPARLIGIARAALAKPVAAAAVCFSPTGCINHGACNMANGCIAPKPGGGAQTKSEAAPDVCGDRWGAFACVLSRGHSSCDLHRARGAQPGQWVRW